MLFSRLKTKTRLILTIQSICMLSGTATHLLWIINNGFLSEKNNVPMISRLFWDSLTFLDPLAAVLLIIKPKTGLYLTAAIITVDVIHNSIICFRGFSFETSYFIRWMQSNWMLISQITFGLFVLITFNNNYREIKSQIKNIQVNL
jgi:hypothetical protein